MKKLLTLFAFALVAFTANAQSCPDGHHPHLIDLGLPSGTKWACCNMGADKPEEYGNYYSWGEMEVKNRYDWTTYTLCDGTKESCHNLGESICGTKYDVAHMKWKETWKMPSLDQVKELSSNCTTQWTTINGVNGRLFTSKENGNSIFLPAAGYMYEAELVECGETGCYWSGHQHNSYKHGADIIYFKSDKVYSSVSSWRSDGIPVRPVATGLEGDVNGDGDISVSDVAWIVNHILGMTDSNFIIANADINSDGEIDINDVMGAVSIILGDNGGGNGSGIGDTSQAYLTCPDDHHPHIIDLGLPSGTKWACCNVGASTPEGYGGYYAWGETEVKDVYNEVKYQYCTGVDNDGNGFYDDYPNEAQYHDLGLDIAGTQYDVAHVRWGGSWVMPSKDQLNELCNNCNHGWTIVNGVKGRKFTSETNGGTIFLPAAGYRLGDELYGVGSHCFYWSSTQTPWNSESAYSLYIYPGDAIWGSHHSRYGGQSVRPVSR